MAYFCERHWRSFNIRCETDDAYYAMVITAAVKIRTATGCVQWKQGTWFTRLHLTSVNSVFVALLSLW